MNVGPELPSITSDTLLAKEVMTPSQRKRFRMETSLFSERSGRERAAIQSPTIQQSFCAQSLEMRSESHSLDDTASS